MLSASKVSHSTSVRKKIVSGANTSMIIHWDHTFIWTALHSFIPEGSWNASQGTGGVRKQCCDARRACRFRGEILGSTGIREESRGAWPHSGRRVCSAHKERVWCGENRWPPTQGDCLLKVSVCNMRMTGHSVSYNSPGKILSETHIWSHHTAFVDIHWRALGAWWWRIGGTRKDDMPLSC